MSVIKIFLGILFDDKVCFFTIEMDWPTGCQIQIENLLQFPQKKKFVKFYFHDTVKHVYNGHPWDLKKVAVWNRCLIKLRFRLVVDETIWPLLTGGRYSQVVVKTCLTVYFFLNKRFKYFLIYLKLKLIFEVMSTRTVFHYLLVSTKTFGESKILRNHYFCFCEFLRRKKGIILLLFLIQFLHVSTVVYYF
jgi:hypothetical protein